MSSMHSRGRSAKILASPELGTFLKNEGAEAETMTSAAIRRHDAFGNRALDQGRARGEYFDRLAPAR